MATNESFDRFCQLARLRAELALQEAEVGHKWIENEILDLERQGKVERIGQIKEIRDQAHREIVRARRQQRLVDQEVGILRTREERTRRIFEGRRLLQPSRDWYAFWQYIDVARVGPEFWEIANKPITEHDTDPDHFILPYRRLHEPSLAIPICEAANVLGLVADHEIAALEARAEKLKAGSVERWQKAVEMVLGATETSSS